MRRNKGMTLVEVLAAMLITLILGGTAIAFFRSGLDLDQANTVSASNQQGLRAPFMSLAPLIERAGRLEILPSLPETDTLEPDELVAFVADDWTVKALPNGQPNMYFRTRSGDAMVPGFSNVKSVRFARTSLRPSGASLNSEDQAVHMTLTASSYGKELAYTTDVRSLNRAPVEGLETGRYLKIAGDFGIYDPEIMEGELVAGKVKSSDISGMASLPVGTEVVGYFGVVAGNSHAEVEYEWRLYSKTLDVDKMINFDVIGAPTGNYSAAKFPDLEKHYLQRFTRPDLSFSPPTGTTAHTTPPYLLELTKEMLGKHIALAVRQKGSGLWFQSKAYLIATGQNSGFWKDLLDELAKDLNKKVDKDPKTGQETHYEGEYLLPGKKYDMEFGNVDPKTQEPHLRLSGEGDTGRGFLTKELAEKYFRRLQDGTRDPEFCLENYTLWVDAIVETPEGSSSTSASQPTKGWGAFLNGNTRKMRAASDKVPTDHFHYGYMLQFDPGVEFMGFVYQQIADYVPYFYNKSLGKTFTDLDNMESARGERPVKTQGMVLRRLDGDQHNGAVAYGIDKVHRWKEKNDGTVKNFADVGNWGNDWRHRLRYYLWRDIAYKGAGTVYDPVDKRSYQNSFAFVPASNDIHSMRDQRFVVEINIITQTSKRGTETVPERMFFRVRVYDRPREYVKNKKQWVFPASTGRSKEMWFGIERGRGLNWGLPYSASYNHVTGNGFVQGDTMYEPAPLENTTIRNLRKTQYTGDAIGKHFGLRIWADSKFDAKIYFIDVAKGLPLNTRLPWGTKVEEVMKPLNRGGNWDQDKPYVLKNPFPLP